MSDEEGHKPEPAKPNRLAGLVAAKGVAPRPAEQPQREPETPKAPAPSPPAVLAGMGSKSLTLRLPEAEYERLRAHAFASRKTHQTILAEALKTYLDAAT